jgi:hypothetical protein
LPFGRRVTEPEKIGAALRQFVRAATEFGMERFLTGLPSSVRSWGDRDRARGA